ncbi:HIT family protein [Rhodococcus sp. H29-C3]|uniref:HIT family protein n=1 Tax=Rhodococcus sp. H29-C3 TaxID=3046307 RepID=UPI0024B9D21F|nr:HIT family protein [Rhodococcus sp. H29-C3]MDJ0362930.1 HIT family protein [Rhodococcus sp. H29-C3]
MIECVFCGIVEGVLPATIVFETDDVLAFLDIRPVARGHVLVVPKVHAADLDSLDPTLGAAVFAAGHHLSRAFRRSDLNADGANLVVNDGRAAFQTVFHTHLHVVPRWAGDKLRFAGGFVFRRLRKPEETADAIKEGILRLSREGRP